MQIKARNLLADNSERTFLTNPEVAGTNVLRWKNPSVFSASWAIQVGQTGNAQTEIVLLNTSTPSGTAGTLTANTLYEHPTDTSIYAIKYDQIVFERSFSGTTGTATPITNGTISIQPSSPFTVFDDTAGTPGQTAYKTYFKNSVLNLTSTESDWITSTGFSFYALGKMRQRVKDRLYDATFIPVDLMIDDWINEWQQEMNNVLVDINQDYSLGTVNIGFQGTTELGTISNSDFRGQLKRVWYFDGSGTFQATKMDSASYSPTKTFITTYPYYYMQGDSVIGRKPNDQAGTLMLEYDQNYPLMVEDTDILPVPFQSYTKSFIDYAEGQARKKDNKPDLAAALIQEAEAKREEFKRMAASRLRSGPTYEDIVEDVGGAEDVWLT